MNSDSASGTGAPGSDDEHLLEPVEPFTDPHGFGAGRTQDAPLMEQNRATTKERIDGILAQTGADLGDHPVEDIAVALRERFGDAQIEVADEELERMARTLVRSEQGVPEGTFEAYREQDESE